MQIEPCPFCASKTLFLQSSTEDREGVSCNIFCDSCGARGPTDYVPSTEIEACYANGTFPPIIVKLWNKRANL